MTTTAYATGDDLVARYDIDMVSDLATDREVVSRADIVDHPHVVTALEDASGEVEVALLAGAQYSVEDLAALSGNAANHLKRIVCGLAIAALHRRRPESADESFIETITKEAREAIKALRRGENIFGLQSKINASKTETAGPSVVDLQTRNDLAFRMDRHFPEPASRIYRG